jgi:hypothetical protein
MRGVRAAQGPDPASCPGIPRCRLRLERTSQHRLSPDIGRHSRRQDTLHSPACRGAAGASPQWPGALHSAGRLERFLVLPADHWRALSGGHAYLPLSLM